MKNSVQNNKKLTNIACANRDSADISYLGFDARPLISV